MERIAGIIKLVTHAGEAGPGCPAMTWGGSLKQAELLARQLWRREQVHAQLRQLFV